MSKSCTNLRLSIVVELGVNQPLDCSLARFVKLQASCASDSGGARSKHVHQIGRVDERERFLTRELLRSLDLGEEWLQFVGLVEANLGQLFLISANGRSEDVGGFEDDTNTACFSVGTNSRIKRLAVWPEKRGSGEVDAFWG